MPPASARGAPPGPTPSPLVKAPPPPDARPHNRPAAGRVASGGLSEGGRVASGELPEGDRVVNGELPEADKREPRVSAATAADAIVQWCSLFWSKSDTRRDFLCGRTYRNRDIAVATLADLGVSHPRLLGLSVEKLAARRLLGGSCRAQAASFVNEIVYKQEKTDDPTRNETMAAV